MHFTVEDAQRRLDELIELAHRGVEVLIEDSRGHMVQLAPIFSDVSECDTPAGPSTFGDIG
jgi:hypothetical protein